MSIAVSSFSLQKFIMERGVDEGIIEYNTRREGMLKC